MQYPFYQGQSILPTSTSSPILNLPTTLASYISHYIIALYVYYSINYNPLDSHLTVRWQKNELFSPVGIFIHYLCFCTSYTAPVSLTMSDCLCNILPDMIFSAPFAPHHLLYCQNLQHWSPHSTAFHTFFKILVIVSVHDHFSIKKSTLSTTTCP